MASLAEHLAEKQLREGTASSQVITHYLKLASNRSKLEEEKIALENELIKAKTKAIADQARTEEMFADAIKAMRSYQGFPEPPSDEEEYYER